MRMTALNGYWALEDEPVRALEPSADLGWIEPELARVDEMRLFLGTDTGWGLPALPAVRAPRRGVRAPPRGGGGPRRAPRGRVAPLPGPRPGVGPPRHPRRPRAAAQAAR